MARATLVSIGGLPATGKTTIARAVCARLGAASVRIDTIERAIAVAEGEHASANDWAHPPGYAIGYEVAADQLRAGLTVVAESVNPLGVTRDAWREVAARHDAALVEVEVVCADAAVHRARAETRVLDIPGLESPAWTAIQQREYEPWSRDRLVLDTADLSPEAAAERVIAAVAALT